ncbi:MAG: type II toxin-antitoxin system RelE/ParE family toxin [Flavobacteriales bacterium]|nr:type II toxin-antitoxin system RelE/ParE family toxin [Flavobacteriales bacterium]
MTYVVRVERKAQKKLAKISEPYYSKIKKAILALAENPRPTGCKQLSGRSGYRIRVADYRIIYEIVDDLLLVEVIELGHRRDIYD